jgi:hypothetical protein
MYIYIYIYQILTDEELAWIIKEHDKNEAEIKHYHQLPICNHVNIQFLIYIWVFLYSIYLFVNMHLLIHIDIYTYKTVS